MAQRRAWIVGVSGCSSSGKTTLCRLLRDIWPQSFILHQDDFYWSDERIPYSNGVQDWDCIEAFDMDRMRNCLNHIKAHGTFPPDLDSIQDRNEVGKCPIDQDVIDKWKAIAKEVTSAASIPIAFVDGLLMYPLSVPGVREAFDLRLFMRTEYRKAKSRREARTGYATIEGFWEDPPGYFDKIVWPNYVKDHAFMFQDGDIDGKKDEAVCQKYDIQVVPAGIEEDMTACLEWACNLLKERCS